MHENNIDIYSLDNIYNTSYKINNLKFLFIVEIINLKILRKNFFLYIYIKNYICKYLILLFNIIRIMINYK